MAFVVDVSVFQQFLAVLGHVDFKVAI